MKGRRESGGEEHDRANQRAAELFVWSACDELKEIKSNPVVWRTSPDEGEGDQDWRTVQRAVQRAIWFL